VQGKNHSQIWGRESRAPSRFQDAKTFPQHDLGRLVFDVLDHVLCHYVVESIIIEWKAFRRIQIDHRVMVGKDVCIQPSVKDVVTGPKLELFQPTNLQVLGDLTGSFNKPHKGLHIPFQPAEGSNQTDNQLRLLQIDYCCGIHVLASRDSGSL